MQRAGAIGFIRKTRKSQLAQLLQKNMPIIERHPANACNIYDGMALLQGLKIPQGATFRMVAEKVLLIVTGSNSNRTNSHLMFIVMYL